MQTKFVVIDETGSVSLGGKEASEPETFATYARAERRAKELAGYVPGHAIGIYELAAEVEAPVGATVTRRK